MRRNIIETIMGGVVLLIAALFLAFAYAGSNLRGVGGYDVVARFNRVDGLANGAEVRLSGIKIGSVVRQDLDPKTYLAEVPGPVLPEVSRRLQAGVELADGPVQIDKFRVVDATDDRALVEVVLHEGRNHIVRRLLEEVGHPVHKLVRTRIGEVRLGNQRPGTLRPLTRAELSSLYTAVDL